MKSLKMGLIITKLKKDQHYLMLLYIYGHFTKRYVDFPAGRWEIYRNMKGGRNSVSEHIGSRSPAGLHPVFLDAIMQYCGLLITQ